MNQEEYSFDLHRHNYAVWTAARSVQRNFTTTAIIKDAIENSDLRNFAEDTIDYSAEDFKVFHKKCANQLIDYFKKEQKFSATDLYGRAAKIIAIYLKTSLILCNKGACAKSKIVHPPIDSILLRNLAKHNKSTLKEVANIRWTNLNEDDYWKLADKIRSVKPFDWTLEVYWEATNDESAKEA